jgi:Cu(I)/Ag(I) efflux system periplasmic protein CusF
LAASAQTDDLVNGPVTKIDESAGKIIIRHGPLKKFGMDQGQSYAIRGEEHRNFNDIGRRIIMSPRR